MVNKQICDFGLPIFSANGEAMVAKVALVAAWHKHPERKVIFSKS